MKFAVVLREAGFSQKDFKKCAEIPITLYDRKDRIDSKEDIRFVEKLFAHNNKSFMDFYDFLKKLESQTEQPESINVRIDEFSVIVFYKTPNIRFFSRQKSMEPLDYMD